MVVDDAPHNLSKFFFSERSTPARAVTCAGVRRSLDRAIVPRSPNSALA